MRHGSVLHGPDGASRSDRSRYALQGEGRTQATPVRPGRRAFDLREASRYVEGVSKVRAVSVEAETGEGPLVRIGELARRAGIAPATLRAWERRYGVIAPRRGESGYRLYSDADEKRLVRMVALIESGVAPAEAARRIGTPPDSGAPGPEPGTGRGPGFVAGCREELAASMTRFDDHGADRVLDRAVAVLSLDALLEEVVLPVLRGLETDTIGQEHFASNLLRGRLLALARGWGAGEGRLAVLACPAGELHDLGLIAFGLALRARGWRIAFLGANTPIGAIVATVEEMQPVVVVLSAITSGAFDGTELELARLGGQARLYLAGAAVSDALLERVEAERLIEGPVGSATSVAA